MVLLSTLCKADPSASLKLGLCVPIVVASYAKAGEKRALLLGLL